MARPKVTSARRVRSAAIALLGVLVTAAAAHAEDGERPRMDEFTAFTVRRHQLKLGILSFEFGLFDNFSIGTDPPAWAASTVVSALVPNLHLKYNFLRLERLRLTGQVGAYYASLNKSNGVNGGVLSMPFTAFASTPLLEKLWLHLEGVYNFIRGYGSGETERADINGAVATESIQLGAMLEYRVRPRLAINLRGRSQVWMRSLEFRAEGDIDPFTRAEFHAELIPKYKHPYAVVASVAYFWDHVQARVGAGYGAYFIPGANLYLSYEGVIPEASLAFLF